MDAQLNESGSKTTSLNQHLFCLSHTLFLLFKQKLVFLALIAYGVLGFWGFGVLVTTTYVFILWWYVLLSGHLFHSKVQKWKSFRIKVLWPSIHKNMIQILNYNFFFQNSAFNLTMQCLCWCYFTNLVALGRKTVNTRVEHILFLLPAIVGMAKMAWWDSHVLQLCLSVFCHQVKTATQIWNLN